MKPVPASREARRMRLAVGLASVVVAAAALITTSVVAPERVEAHPFTYSEPPDGELTLDDLFHWVAGSVPGFAGLHLGEDSHSVVVSMASPDPVAARAALSLVATSLNDLDLETRPLLVKPATYDYVELYAWYQDVSQVAWTYGYTVFTDIDELHNRIVVGSTSPNTTREILRSDPAVLGIPSDAWHVEHADWPTQDATLQSFHRPLVGGLQIGRSGYLCTLGFIAYRAGVPGMVTNSHCSSRFLGPDSTVWGQPLVEFPIAVEGRDPTTFTGGACHAEKRCRYSDAAWARLETPVLFGSVVPDHQLGRIAAPGSFGDAISWNGVDKFQITSKSSPLVNEATSFVGRTSGRQVGVVGQTCVGFGVSGHPDVILLCQSAATASGAPGDSGAPMFRTTGVGPAARLHGVRWGSLSGNSVFSTIGQMQRTSELGVLLVCTATC